MSLNRKADFCPGFSSGWDYPDQTRTIVEHCKTDSAVNGVNESAVVPSTRQKLAHGTQAATAASAKRVHPLRRSRTPRSRSGAARSIGQSAADEGAHPCGGRTPRAHAERGVGEGDGGGSASGIHSNGVCCR